MAILKSETNLILSGKVIPAGETFECLDYLGDSLLSRGFASKLKEAIPLTPESLSAPENIPVVDTETEVDSREAEIRDDYDKLEKEELIEAAKAIGLNIPGRISKEKLIDALVKAELEGDE